MHSNVDLKFLRRRYKKHPEFQGIGEAVIEYLNQRGGTISDSTKADSKNRDFLSKPVWHNKTDLDKFVVKKLNLQFDNYYYKQSNDKHGNSLYNATVSVIKDLRMSGAIVDLKSDVPNTAKGIWRLNDISTMPLEEEIAKKEMDMNNFHCSGELTTIFARRKQGIFKKILQKQYGYCLFCGFDLKQWMVGAHIVPYSIMRTKDAINSMNPVNGLLLCKMCDVAFEHGYIMVEKDYGIIITDYLQEQRKPVLKSWLDNIEPEMSVGEDTTYKPSTKYLEWKKELVLDQMH